MRTRAAQVLIEVDFIKHTLARYLSLPANRVFSTVEALLTPFLGGGGDDDDEDEHAHGDAGDDDASDPYAHSRRKELLVAAQGAAAIMFECFV